MKFKSLLYSVLLCGGRLVAIQYAVLTFLSIPRSVKNVDVGIGLEKPWLWCLFKI